MINSTLLELMEETSCDGLCLDVGCGRGDLALGVRGWYRRVVGIDKSRSSIKEAQERARKEGASNVEFHLRDADRTSYREFGPPDVVASHFFMSPKMIRKAASALQAGGYLAFACIGEGNLHELGVESHYAFSEERIEALLEKHFDIEYLDTEEVQVTYGSTDEALRGLASMKEKWMTNGRWKNLLEYLDGDGRTITYRTLVARARKV